MADTIWQEASRKSKGISDIDYHRKLYSMPIQDVDHTGKPINYLVNFVSPYITTYERNRYYLLANSEIKKVPESYYYRPDYMSYKEYKTTNYWTLLLFINNISLIEEFDKPEIYVPSLASVLSLNTQIDDFRKVESLNNPLYTPKPNNGENSILYTKNTQVRIPEEDNTKIVPALSGEFYYHREQFTVNSLIALQKYVDLSKIANVNSVIFSIDNQKHFVYGKDYIVKKGTDGKMRRVSWKQSDMTNGDGLSSVIEEGMIIEVQYAIGVL